MQQECYYIGESKNGAEVDWAQIIFNSLCSELDPLLKFLFFQINQVDYMGFYLLEDMYFLLEAKGLNANGYLLTNQFDYNDRFDN